ncbi:hypothetical protein GJU40_06990 [Bacillus lacus]|uniref:Uncharacterized protein n=1 Tax=Metabacillus lacus TaxID=1983721 RepID=A0A7X2LYJ8_9BACI|nr:hypothetical protein [Metabacillus lacus]MRX71918.1 hypothetical protein [Metabacillus lacus]
MWSFEGWLNKRYEKHNQNQQKIEKWQSEKDREWERLETVAGDFESQMDALADQVEKRMAEQGPSEMKKS